MTQRPAPGSGRESVDPRTEGDLVEETVAFLRSRGERITESRRLVIEELTSATSHLAAEDLLARVQARLPSVHLATVYRTLEALVQCGVAAHVHLPHGATTYHVVRPGHRSHLHLVCQGCDELIDIPADTLDQVAATVDRTSGFLLDPQHVALTGWCQNCRPT